MVALTKLVRPLPLSLKCWPLCEVAHAANFVWKEVAVDGVEGSGGPAFGFFFVS